MSKMKIAVGCDHIVTEIKNEVVKYLEKKGIEVMDCGTYDKERTHYPIYGKRVGEKVALKEADLGIVLCGTGVGITNAVNKIKGIRCVLTQDVSVVRYAREVLNANVLGFGGRVSGMGVIEDLIDAFLETEYAETEERNQMIEKIDHLIQHDPACGKVNLFDDLLEKWERGEYHD